MSEAINCPKDNCNGVLEEGIRGFYKCTVCGAKVKKSLVESRGSVVTTTNKTISVPVVPVIAQAQAVETNVIQQEVITNIEPQSDIGGVQQVGEGVTEEIVVAPKVAKAPKPPVAPKNPKTPTQKVTTGDGVTLVGKTTAIKCMDCGAERIIKVQDVFQVKRCIDCQKTFAKARRAEKAKEKRATPTV